MTRQGVEIMEWQDAKVWENKGCPYCKENLRYAKKHNLRCIVDTNTMDVIGVEIKENN